MPKQKLAIGDAVRVTGYRPPSRPPAGAEDLATEELFQSMVGRRYTVRGFDDYGHIELHPKRGHWVWIEPDLVERVEERAS